MRHGQASFGAENYDQLSERGTAQAAATGRHFHERGTRHAEVCVGPRARHRQTAKALVDALEIAPPHRDVMDLDEFADSTQIIQAVGPTDGRSPIDCMLAGIEGWVAGTLVIETRPSFVDFRRRVGAWLLRELQLASHAEPRLIVTSAGVVGAAVCEALGLPDDAFVPLVCQIRNASLTEIAVSRGRPMVLSFNVTGHLPQSLLTAI